MTDAYIAGIACRFPSSSNVQEFWQNLVDGVDMTGPTRWPQGLFGLPPRMGCIPDLGVFDADYFGYSETEAHHSNLLLRLLLEVMYECVVDSGLVHASLCAEETGFYLACTSSDADVITSSNVTDSNNCNLGSSLVKEVAAAFRLRGPVMAVDSACSSSFGALRSAVSDLRSGRCSYAVVAGVNLVLSPNTSQCLNQLGLLSPTAESRVFDESADGYVRSDGVGVLLLSRTVNKSERIYASIDGIEVFCDGYKEGGILSPDKSSQSRLLSSLYGEGSIPTSVVSYIEANGTGDKGWDKVELDALMDTLCKGRDEPLLVGSVKSNMGHCEAAAGMASLIKCVLSVHHGLVPASLHCRNPSVPKGKIKVVDQNHKLKGRMNVIGISCFGFGGVNGHVVLMSYKNPIEDTRNALSCLIPLTLRAPESLERLQIFLEENVDNVGILRLVSRSMLAHDENQPIRGYAKIRVPEKKREPPLVCYTIHVTTGVVVGAGTDAVVTILLHGSQRSTGNLPLRKNGEDAFERGKTNEFIIQERDLGEIRGIVIGHNDSGMMPGWFLDKITVHSSSLDKSWTFPCNQWLARDKHDGRIQRELSPTDTECREKKVLMNWSICESPNAPVSPLWILMHDVIWSKSSVSSDLLQMNVFRKSLQESDEILQRLGSDVSVTECLKSSPRPVLSSKRGLVTSLAVSIGLLDVIKASDIRVNGYIGSGLSEICLAYVDGCFSKKQCFQLGLAIGNTLSRLPETNDHLYSIKLDNDLIYKLGPKLKVLIHISNAHFIAKVGESDREYILNQLQNTGGVYTELPEQLTLYHTLPQENIEKLKENIASILPAPRKRSGKYRSCTFTNSSSINDVKQLCDASYFCNLLQRTVYQSQAINRLPKNVRVLSVGLTDVSADMETADLHCYPNVESVLEILGELHMLGHKLNTVHLYPDLPPLDCSTPPIGHLATWDHHIKWQVPDWCQFTDVVKNKPLDDYHLPVIECDGSVYDPFAILIFHSWAAICGSKEKLKPIILSDFTVSPDLTRQEYLSGAKVQVHRGKQTFFIEREGILMRGKYDLPEQVELPLLPGYDVDQNDNVAKLPDECDMDVETQELLWEDSWLDFINTTLEFVNPRTQNLPIQVMIDPEKHLHITRDCASVLVMMEEVTGLCKAGALVLQFQPYLRTTLNQSLFAQSLAAASCSKMLAEHILLYSLAKPAPREDKLLMYLGLENDKNSRQLGFVLLTNGDSKHTSLTLPKAWKDADCQVLVPYLIAHHIVHELTEIQPADSVLVLPPLDTVSIYTMSMLMRRKCQVYTSTWDNEMSVMLESAFPNIKVIHQGNLRSGLLMHTRGKGVDVCIKNDGSEIDYILNLLANGGKCILAAPSSEKDHLSMASFLRNLTVMTMDPAHVFSQFLDDQNRLSKALEMFADMGIRECCEDGYPEDRGLQYCMEEQFKFSQPVALQKLFALMDDPSFRPKDVLEKFSETDIESLEKLQQLLDVRPQECSLALEDLSCFETKDNLNTAHISASYFETSRYCTPRSSVLCGYRAPPNTCLDPFNPRKCHSIDLCQFTSASTPVIRVFVEPAAQTPKISGSFSDGSKTKFTTSFTSGDDKMFASPTKVGKKHVPNRLELPETVDFLFVSSPKSPLTPHSPTVRDLFTPTKSNSVLVKLNKCESSETPVFILHSISGTVHPLKDLGSKLKVPCYGIQKTPCTPGSSVADMAGFYRNAIELQNPEGPYRLIGYGYGGMISFEIAKQLQKLGKMVEFLIILNGGPGYVHSQIKMIQQQIKSSLPAAALADITEIGALVSFIQISNPEKSIKFLPAILQTLQSKYDRLHTTVDYLMGGVIASKSPNQTKWLTARNKLLFKDKKKLDFPALATEVLRLCRERKAEDYVSSILTGYKYRPQEKLEGDIHLLRVKSDPSLHCPVPSDYGLGALCSGECKLKFMEGDHLSFLQGDQADEVVKYIHEVIRGH